MCSAGSTKVPVGVRRAARPPADQIRQCKHDLESGGNSPRFLFWQNCLARVLTLLTIITAIIAPLPARSQELTFTQYTPENEVNPLPSAEIHKVYQDRLGYIWLAVFSSGLIRYDGNSMIRYTTEDGLPDLGVWEILEDAAGRLWVGTNTGLVVSDMPLASYTHGQRITFSATIGAAVLPKTMVFKNRLAVDTRGGVWVGTRDSGIIRYRFNQGPSVSVDTIETQIHGASENIAIHSILVRKDGSVWVGLGGGDLLVFPRDSSLFEILPSSQTLLVSDVNTIHESPSGILLGGCRDGFVWKLKEENGRRSIEQFSRALRTNISTILVSSDNTVWVGSEGSGVLAAGLSGGSPHTVYTRSNGLLSEHISHIFEDREGNIWFAQSGGVSKLRFDYAAFQNFTANSNGGEVPVLTSPSINAVLPLLDIGLLSGVWVGTSEGGVVCIGSGDRVAAFDADMGLRNNRVNGLLLDEKGRLWIGTARGINCLTLESGFRAPDSRESRAISFRGRNGLITGYRRTTVFSCRSFHIPLETGMDRTIESLWFPGYQNIYCLVSGEWYVFKESSGLPNTSYQAVAIDEEGRLWVGTRDSGLHRSRIPISLSMLRKTASAEVEYQLGTGAGLFGKEITSPLFEEVWSRSFGAPTDNIETLIWRDSVLWVGTAEGLVALEGAPLRMTSHLTLSDGLGANNATSMAFSPTSGTLWVGTNGGLTEIDPKARRVMQTVTKQDGLVDNEVWYYGSVSVDSEGTVYFGTAKGLATYRPHLDRSNRVNPVLRVSDASFTQDYWGNNEFSIRYAALSFSDERQIRYKTRLVGYDKAWSPEKPDVRIRYTNLPAIFFSKKYVFKVLAGNADGLWTEDPLQYSFVAQPGIWFRWWAFLLQLTLLAGVAFSLHKHRTGQLKQRARVLERTVEERTVEIQAKAEELEEKNAEILRAQKQLIVQEKLASLGSLTAGIAHEIKNPLNFVNNFAQLSVELVEELREDIEKNKQNLDKETAENIDEILQDLEQNVSKINEHGKRADNIVHGMLLHSQGQKGERQQIDLNALLDEQVNLAYHGIRGKDTKFNVTLERNYDDSVGLIDAVPQNLSRVFLNILNNALYAAFNKTVDGGGDYVPIVSVFTESKGDQVQIRIRDTGNGIPEDIREKIFNPFFTTKPTGQGTGLGLSISHDIVVEEHMGEIRVETEQGSFAEFIISLPKSWKTT